MFEKRLMYEVMDEKEKNVLSVKDILFIVGICRYRCYVLIKNLYVLLVFDNFVFIRSCEVWFF